MDDTPRGSGRSRLPVLLFVLAAACSHEVTPYQSPPLPPPVVRLADRLDRAHIDSPLTDVEGAWTLEQLRPLQCDDLLDEGFEHFDAVASGWSSTGGQAEVAEVDGHRALHVRRLDPNLPQRWMVEAHPTTPYLFERSLRAGGRPPFDLVVVEMKADEFAVKEDRGLVPVRVHWPRGQVEDGWQRGSLSFLSGPTTTWLSVQLMPRPNARAAATAGQGDGWFDDVRLQRADLSFEQQMALLKPRYPAPGADPKLGIAKRGQLAPMPSPSLRHSPEHDNFSHRYALYAPAPTDLGFPLDVGGGATLTFSTCLARETRPGDSARFEVLVRDGDHEQSLWTRTVAAVPEQWRWQSASVDLSDFAGRSIELVLRTRAEHGHPHALWGNAEVRVPPPPKVLRNVILIAVDTLRADRLSCYGFDQPTTPHLDALAEDGVRFANSASNSTWTSPSFASIFTGVVPSRHGVFDAAGSQLPEDVQTLAERFREHGWATQSIIYKAPLYYGGYDRGFDVAFNVPGVFSRADDNLAEALAWLDRSEHRCNFLFLHFDDPHQPFNQPEPFQHRFGEDPAKYGLTEHPTPELGILSYKVDNNWPPTPQLRQVMRGLYTGEVAYVDDRIGAFLDELKRRGLYDNAVIAFLADHGEELWEHGRQGHGEDRLGDEIVHVPLIIKPPAGVLAHGKVVQTQVRGFDVMPTLLELAGIPVEGPIDAQSLLPLLEPGTPDPEDRLAITEVNGAFALRNHHWKYVLRSTPSMWAPPARPPEALFDLPADPDEAQDVAEQHPDVLGGMRLTTLDYLLSHRAGRYLVGIAADPSSEWSSALRTATATFSFYGLQAQSHGEGKEFRGHEPTPLMTVAMVFGDKPVAVEGSPTELEFKPYRPGDLQRLVESKAAGLHAFEGAQDLRAPIDELPQQDLEMMRNLHNIGYTGGRPDDDSGGDHR